jgi:putative transcriptional regulator
MSGELYFPLMVRTTADGRDNRVRPYRVLTGLTQAQLAVAVGVSRQTVVAIEAGDYAPSVYLALRLAEVLGGTVEQLFAPPDGSGAAAGIRPPTVSREE